MVENADIPLGSVQFYDAPCEGYGPFEDTGNPDNGVIRYAENIAGKEIGGRKLSTIQRVSQIWMVGDVGVPKKNPTINQLPTAGYNTDVTAIQPVIGSGWTTVASAKQPACRHNGRTVESFADGHVESSKWADLDVDLNDIFAENSF
jgi:prepilin-type processing-associated H-X9-DG protein